MFFEDEKKYYKEQQLKLKRERTLKKKAQQAKYIEMLLKSKEAKKDQI